MTSVINFFADPASGPMKGFSYSQQWRSYNTLVLDGHLSVIINVYELMYVDARIQTASVYGELPPRQPARLKLLLMEED
jgi:hypothetical protein